MPVDSYQPRKKPLQDRSKITCDAILEAAAHILVQEGYVGLTTNHIVRRAGVSIGSLYQYFPNKEAIVAGLIERYVADDQHYLESMLHRLAAEPIEVAVRQLIAAMLGRCQADLTMAQALRDQIPRVEWTGKLRQTTSGYVELLLGLLSARYPEAENLHMITFNLVYAVDGIINAAIYDRPEWIGDERFKETICQMVLGSLARFER